MHQDGSYADYLVPAEMITCWVALDDTRAQGGTIEYVRGSHRWPKAPPARQLPRARGLAGAGARRRRAGRAELERVPVVVKAGGCDVPPLAHVPRLGPQRGHDRTAARSSPTWFTVETRFHPDQRGPRVLALPPPRRPVARRVVLPGLGGRRPQRLAGSSGCPSANSCPQKGGFPDATTCPAARSARRGTAAGSRSGGGRTPRGPGTASGRRPSRSAGPGHEVGQRALDQRRLAHDGEAGLGRASPGRPAKRSDSALWVSHSTLTP